MAKKTCLRQLLTKWGDLSIEQQEAIANDVSYDSTMSRDEEDAAADEVFAPAEEVTEAQQEAPVEESDQDVDPFPGE